MMKKILLFIFVALMPLLGFARNYGGWKGFVDASGGGSYFNNHKQKLIVSDDIGNPSWHLAFGLNFTGGYQISPQWFCGVGSGGYIGFWAPYGDFYAVYVPVYADIRWTLDIEKRVCPFIDFKIGYQFGGPTDSDYATYKNGIYLLPSAGIRLGKANGTGFNIGIGYNVSIGRKFYEVHWDYYGARYNLARYGNVGESHQGVFLLILGVDF